MTKAGTKQGSETEEQVSNLGDLSQWITGANADQLQQWMRLESQVYQFQELVSHLPLEEEERQQIYQYLLRAQHHLDYRRPYTITVVGVSGAGKSTLINALLGRRLVKFQYGRPTTGTIVNVVQQRSHNGTRPPEEAVIQYHSLQSLTDAVEAQCSILGEKPVYRKPEAAAAGDGATAEDGTMDPSSNLDIVATLEMVRDWKVRENGPVQCPHCHEENRPGARVCGFCGKQLPIHKTVSKKGVPEHLDALEDLLETAHLQKDRLGTEDVLMLDNPKQEKQVQDVMDEESLINKDRERRVIPLIRSIEYRIRTSDTLAHVNLTDVPGVAARTTLHEKHLRDQLDPFKTDAIILVMPPDRPELLTNQLLPLVKEVLMVGLDADQRRIAAGRIFLIVSKGDIVHGMSEQEAEQETRDNVEKVAREITPDFFQRYARNTFFDVKALPALTAQLILNDPARGHAWLYEQNDDALFRDISRKHYRDCIVRARAEVVEKVNGEELTVLQWSRIPELQKTLKEFLGRSRWQQALYEASALYQNAHAIATDRINADWIQLTGKPFGNNVDKDLANLTTDRSVRYGERLQRDVYEVLEHFERACEDLKRQSNRDRLRTQIQQVVTNVQRKIAYYVKRPAFRESFANTIEDPIYDDLYTMQGVPGPLIELQSNVFRWFDEEVYKVAETMMTAFLQELDREQVESLLQDFCYNDFYLDKYLSPYHEEIIGEIRNNFDSACRGAILYQLFHRKVANEIMNRHTGFGQVLTREGKVETVVETGTVADPPLTTEGGSIDMLIETIITQYQSAHKDLVERLPTMLTYLFFYHLTIARDEMRQMVKNLSTRLSQDVRDPKCPLYIKLQEEESGLAGGAENLVNYWKQLGELQLRLNKRGIPRVRAGGSGNGYRTAEKR